MSCPSARTARIALLVAVAAAASFVSACSAGQIAQTARDVASIEGADATRGGVAIRDAKVATPPGGSYARGSDAPMYASIATDDKTSDTLVGVKTDATASVTLAAAPGAGSTSPSPTASGSASASAPAAPSAAPSAPIDVRLAAATLTAFKHGGTYLQLRGLTRNLTPGTTIKVTFTFARVGDVTFDVPVATPSSPGPRPTPSPSAGGGE